MLYPNNRVTLHTYQRGLDKQKFEHKIINIFYPSNITYVLDAKKNHLNETVPLSSHNICFG